MGKLNLGQAIECICKELKNDPAYRIAWEANIAMAFKDQFHFCGHKHDPEVVHEVANKAAATFLDQLIGKDMGDVDGMLAVAKLHQQAKPTPIRQSKEVTDEPAKCTDHRWIITGAFDQYKKCTRCEYIELKPKY